MLSALLSTLAGSFIPNNFAYRVGVAAQSKLAGISWVQKEKTDSLLSKYKEWNSCMAMLPFKMAVIMYADTNSYKGTYSSFHVSVQGNSRSLWFCFTSICDWLAKLAPHFQPMRYKTNRVLLARVFARLMLVTCISLNSDWFIALFAPVMIGQSNYFGFGIKTFNWKPLCKPYTFFCSCQCAFRCWLKRLKPQI